MARTATIKVELVPNDDALLAAKATLEHIRDDAEHRIRAIDTMLGTSWAFDMMCATCLKSFPPGPDWQKHPCLPGVR